MSVNYYAIAMIGCKITKPEQLWHRDKFRACEHQVKDSDKFCPHCGKSTEWVTQYSRKFGDDANYWMDKLGYHGEWGYDAEINGVKIRCSTDGKESFAGLLYAITDEHSDKTDIDRSDLESLMDATQEFLEPLGLWDFSTFGLWAILHCSY